jgi:hypothetical protein
MSSERAAGLVGRGSRKVADPPGETRLCRLRLLLRRKHRRAAVCHAYRSAFSLTQIEHAKNTDPIEQVAHDIPNGSAAFRRKHETGYARENASRKDSVHSGASPYQRALQLRHRSSRDQLLHHNKNQQ